MIQVSRYRSIQELEPERTDTQALYQRGRAEKTTCPIRKSSYTYPDE